MARPKMADYQVNGMEKTTSSPASFFLYDETSDEDEVSHIDPSYKPKKLKLTGTSIESSEFDVHYAKICVLYTGGTIGMKSHGGVYSPEPNYLVPQLKKLPMFHDAKYLATIPMAEETNIPLAMPISKEGKRVVYTVYEYEPLLDSANMTFDDYARLARDVQKQYDKFDGFVILHGTDTMSYTASALSFMFEDLGKPIILTGSQIPIFETRSDGRDNLLGALILAGHYCIPEVTVYFHNTLLRGSRSSKVDTGAFDAFKSPNMSPLVELEISIKVNWDAVFQPKGMEKFKVHTQMCPNVGILRLFPSITSQTVQAFLQPPMQGVVIQSYGAGNGPDARSDLLAVFKAAADRGVLVVNITQCSRGAVSTSYATGKAMLDNGVLPGGDMTPEAALMKLSYILGKSNWDFDTMKKMLGLNLRGEISITKDTPTETEITLIERLAEAMRLSSSEEIQNLKEQLIPSMLCAAVHEGSIAALEKLHDQGAYFGAVDYDGRTCLHIACSEGNLEIAKYLLNHGASVHRRDRYGHSPLDDAVRFNRHDIIKILVHTGAHLAMPPTKLGMQLCSTTAHEEAVGLKSWYLAGADLNQGDYTKRTALHVAAAKGKKEAVFYLLSMDVVTDVKDDFGHTPIEEAENNGHAEIVQMINDHKNRKIMTSKEAWK